jgi:PIH1 N-terminal domain
MPESVSDALQQLGSTSMDGAANEALRFPLSVGERREDVDHTGAPCYVVDAIFNADIVRTAGCALRAAMPDATLTVACHDEAKRFGAAAETPTFLLMSMARWMANGLDATADTSRWPCAPAEDIHLQPAPGVCGHKGQQSNMSVAMPVRKLLYMA